MMQLMGSPETTFFYNTEVNRASSGGEKSILCVLNAKDALGDIKSNSLSPYCATENVRLIVTIVTGTSENTSKLNFNPFQYRSGVKECVSKNTFFDLSEALESASDIINLKKKNQLNARCLLAQVNYLEESNEREASRVLMRSIESSLKSRQLMCLNAILENLESYALTPRVLVSALRTTFRVKDLLPRWNVALRYTESQLNAFGLDADAWLMGLKNGRQ